MKSCLRPVVSSVVFVACFQVVSSCGSKTMFGDKKPDSAAAEDQKTEGTGNPAPPNQDSSDVGGLPDLSQNPSVVVQEPVAVSTVVPPLVPTPPAGCEANLGDRFGGYTLKGGTSVDVPGTFSAYPGKTATLTFPQGSKLSYANGKISAAAGVTSESRVNFVARIPGVAACEANLSAVLLPDGAFVATTPIQRGLKGKLYRLPANTRQLPNFATMTPSGDVYMPTINVPARDFTQGFPGVAADLVEWFAIDFRGRLNIDDAGDYQFQVLSDDGSRLYLRGVEIINNDGHHPPRSAYSQKMRLEKGSYPLRLSYFQGPRTALALQLFYKGPGMASFRIIPQSMLRVAP